MNGRRVKMYEYEEVDYGVVIQKYHDRQRDTEVAAEVFLQGDEATAFLRDMNRAGQKERSKRCNPNNIPIRQNIMAAYF
jgi:hypothetical protein